MSGTIAAGPDSRPGTGPQGGAAGLVGLLGSVLTVAMLYFGGPLYITQAIANGSGVAIGLVIVMRGSDDDARRMGWLLALAFLGIQIGTMSVLANWLFDQGHGHAAAWAAVLSGSADAEFGMGVLTVVTLVPILFLAVAFPDGRIAPGWRWYPWAVAIVISSLTVAAALHPPHVGAVEVTHPFLDQLVAEWWTPVAEISLLAVSVLLLVSMWSLVARYRDAAATAAARQQIKWFAFGLGLYVVTIISLLVGEVTDQVTSDTFVIVDGLMFTLIPASLGMAIMRHRLYDIDRIISRTLAYALTFALLTGLFVLIATSPVLIAGSEAQSFSTLLVSVSTLVVAALFNPLRRRLVRGLQRRFDRANYDAERVIEDFGDQVNELTQLSNIEADLHDVLARTLAPASVGIWMADRDS